jgi:hypothetical protein
MSSSDNENESDDIYTPITTTASHIKKKYNDKKIRCECGTIIMKCNISHHIKTKRHAKNLDLVHKGLL